MTRARRAWNSQGQHAKKDRVEDKRKNKTNGGSTLRQDETTPFVSTDPLHESLDPDTLHSARLQITVRASNRDEAEQVLAMLDLIPNPYGEPPRPRPWGA